MRCLLIAHKLTVIDRPLKYLSVATYSIFPEYTNVSNVTGFQSSEAIW